MLGARRGRAGLVLGCAAVVALVSGCRSGSGDAAPSESPASAPTNLEDALDIVVADPVAATPLEAAIAERDLRAAGLTFRRLEAATAEEGLGWLADGRADVWIGPPVPALFELASEGVRVVADAGSGSPDCPVWGLVATPGQADLVAGDLSGLAGHAVAVTDADGLHHRLYLAGRLEHGGLETVEVIDGGTDPTQRLASGDAVAAVVDQPAALATADESLVAVPPGERPPREQAGVVVLGPSLLSDRATVDALIGAYLAGIARVNDALGTADLGSMARWSGHDPAAVDGVCWPVWSPVGDVDTASLVAAQEAAVEAGVLDDVVAPSDFWDPRVIRRVVADQRQG